MTNKDFYKEETRNGFFVDSKRKQLWSVELEILEVFLDICTKHNLLYFAIDGTLLGAVRHKGFIPWDDDVDVGMPRKDYEEFLRIAPSLLPPHLSLHYRRVDPKVPWHYFAKIRNRNTTFIWKNRAHCDINHGVNIDIFPMDGLPKDDRAWGKFERRRRRFDKWDDKIRSSWKDTPTGQAKLLLLPFLTLRTLFGPNFFHNQMEKLFMESDFDGADFEIHTWWNGITRGKHDRRNFDRHILLDIEHLKLRCPEGYDAYLKETYGDYMTPPPPEKRGTWHDAFTDCDRPYTDYFPYTRCFDASPSATPDSPSPEG